MRTKDQIFDLVRGGNAETLRGSITPANLNLKDPKGYWTLMLAAYNGNLEVTKLLLVPDLIQTQETIRAIQF